MPGDKLHYNRNMEQSIYTSGAYGVRNPEWHAGDSAWKADRVASILSRNHVEFSTCVEVGCGAGHVLADLARRMPAKRFTGFDIAPAASALWPAAGSNLAYRFEDFTAANESFDLMLLLDVFEHVEDYIGFLRKLRGRAQWFVFHIPLDMHVSALLRDRQLYAREQVGHLHYFSRATALATVTDVGYHIVDEQLTKVSQQTRERRRGLTAVTNLFRVGFQALSPRLAAKLLGGYSLLVLARQ